MNYYFDCQCDNFDHTIRFTYDGNPSEITVEVRMNDWLPWWKRVLVAFKYIFKMNRKTGFDYDCTILKKDDLYILEKMIERMWADEMETLSIYELSLK